MRTFKRVAESHQIAFAIDPPVRGERSEIDRVTVTYYPDIDGEGDYTEVACRGWRLRSDGERDVRQSSRSPIACPVAIRNEAIGIARDAGLRAELASRQVTS